MKCSETISMKNDPFYVKPKDTKCFGTGIHHSGGCPGYACPFLNDCIMEYEAGSAVMLECETFDEKEAENK